MIPEVLTTPAQEGRVVWTGRLRGTIAEGVDGWNCNRPELLLLIENASELIVLDPLSFPWEMLRPTDWDIPFVIALPSNLDAHDISLILGASMLSHLTPFDVLIEHRPAVREALTAEWGLDERMWLSARGVSIGETLDALRARSHSRLESVDTEFGSFLAQKDDIVTAHLQDYGAHQRGTLNVLFALVRGEDIFLDVGAHIGTFAIPIAQRLGSSGRVIAVEGCSATAALLIKNVETNALTDQITILQAVVGHADGARVRARIAVRNTGGTSFVPSRGLSRFGQPIRSLDELAAGTPEMKHATILKLDVEGAEMSSLAGGVALLAKARPLIVCEVSREHLRRHGGSVVELDRWFAAADYRIFKITGERNSRDNRWELTPCEKIQGCSESHFDVLAIPRESTRLDDVGLEGQL